jgi:hypothetical protein
MQTFSTTLDIYPYILLRHADLFYVSKCTTFKVKVLFLRIYRFFYATIAGWCLPATGFDDPCRAKQTKMIEDIIYCI